MKQYKSKSSPIVAVRLTVETDGLIYTKWGGKQIAKQGDWIVDNAGECYSIDDESFANTYAPVGGVQGNYVKTATVYAERAETYGYIQTKEGQTAYKTGDMLVYNGEDRTDGYAMSAAKFAERYEPVTNTITTGWAIDDDGTVRGEERG